MTKSRQPLASLADVHARLKTAISSEKLSSAEQKKHAKEHPDDRLYMGTRVWVNLESAEITEMLRVLGAHIEGAASE